MGSRVPWTRIGRPYAGRQMLRSVSAGWGREMRPGPSLGDPNHRRGGGWGEGTDGVRQVEKLGGARGPGYPAWMTRADALVRNEGGRGRGSERAPLQTDADALSLSDPLATATLARPERRRLGCGLGNTRPRFRDECRRRRPRPGRSLRPPPGKRD